MLMKYSELISPVLTIFNMVHETFFRICAASILSSFAVRRCHVIRMGTRAAPRRFAVAPLIILSPFVTHCNSPSHDWWCRCLITPRQNPPLRSPFLPVANPTSSMRSDAQDDRGLARCAAMLSCCHMHIRFVFLNKTQLSVDHNKVL